MNFNKIFKKILLASIFSLPLIASTNVIASQANSYQLSGVNRGETKVKDKTFDSDFMYGNENIHLRIETSKVQSGIAFISNDTKKELYYIIVPHNKTGKYIFDGYKKLRGYLYVKNDKFIDVELFNNK